MAKVKKQLTTRKLMRFGPEKIKEDQRKMSDFIAESLKDYEEKWVGKKEVSVLYEATDLEGVTISSK